LVVGVAGSYCAGKNAVVSILLEQGFRPIDVDRVGHEVLREPAVRRRVVEGFGAEVLGADGEVDRRLLGRRVFARRAALRRLEAVVHPQMVERVRAELSREGGRVVINAALLFRMGLDRLCDLVLCVRAPLRARLARARARDGLGAWQTLRRLAAQRGICPKLNAAGVDIYYVDNDGGLDALRERTLAILREKGLRL
jgi:dephospho-CoA kinase